MKAYIVYQIIDLRFSQHAVGRNLSSLFSLPISTSAVGSIKGSTAKQYDITYKNILRRIIAGPVVHADETKVIIQGEARYVWVFTNMEEVVYVYSASREAVTAQEILVDFRGVLVSDFYAAYDGLACQQQKCLIHLIRNLNEDVRREPFNDEIKAIACSFGDLIRPIIETIDRFGLKARHLRKHKRVVARFYDALLKRSWQTEVAIGYRRRLEKYRERLFTFLDHDGVPWNNNNAEHAIKAFARLRNLIGSNSTPKGIREYLLLLSVSETCRCKGVDFLSFLRSGELDIDAFAMGKRVLKVNKGGSPALAPTGDMLRPALT